MEKFARFCGFPWGRNNAKVSTELRVNLVNIFINIKQHQKVTMCVDFFTPTSVVKILSSVKSHSETVIGGLTRRKRWNYDFDLFAGLSAQMRYGVGTRVRKNVKSSKLITTFPTCTAYRKLV